MHTSGHRVISHLLFLTVKSQGIHRGIWCWDVIVFFLRREIKLTKIFIYYQTSPFICLCLLSACGSPNIDNAESFSFSFTDLCLEFIDRSSPTVTKELGKKYEFYSSFCEVENFLLPKRNSQNLTSLECERLQAEYPEIHILLYRNSEVHSLYSFMAFVMVNDTFEGLVFDSKY